MFSVPFPAAKALDTDVRLLKGFYQGEFQKRGGPGNQRFPRALGFTLLSGKFEKRGDPKNCKVLTRVDLGFIQKDGTVDSKASC